MCVIEEPVIPDTKASLSVLYPCVIFYYKMGLSRTVTKYGQTKQAAGTAWKQQNIVCRGMHVVTRRFTMSLYSVSYQLFSGSSRS